MKQRRRTNTVAAAKRPDVWNPRKVWLIKHYADGHYSLNQEIGEVSSAVDNIRGEIDKLNELKSDVLNSVQSLASIAEENAANTQQTSATMQELGQIVNECSGEVDKIVDTSKGLSQNIEVFTLE